MTELPPEPTVEARLRDYLAAELRQAELDYPHHARPERAVARRRLPIGVALAAITVLVAAVLAPQLLGPVSQGPAAIPMGDDGLPLSIDGEPVLRGEAIAAHAGTGGFLAGGTLVLDTRPCLSRSERAQIGCEQDWTLVSGPPADPTFSFTLDGVGRRHPASSAPRARRPSSRVGAPSPVSGVLAVDAVAWRQPTKGRIPEEAVPPQGGDMNEALVPDFVSALGADGVTIAGYIPKRYVLDGDRTTAGGSPSNPPQDLPIPVYGEDLVTLVGHMVAGVGFVALGSTETPVPPRASVAPSPTVSTAPATGPLPVISPVVDCGRIGADACEQAIVLARAVGGPELAGASRIVVDDVCSPCRDLRPALPVRQPRRLRDGRCRHHRLDRLRGHRARVQPADLGDALAGRSACAHRAAAGCRLTDGFPPSRPESRPHVIFHPADGRPDCSSRSAPVELATSSRRVPSRCPHHPAAEGGAIGCSLCRRPAAARTARAA